MITLPVPQVPGRHAAGRLKIAVATSQAVARPASYHAIPVILLTTASLLLFRTWISPATPGGVDSGFLYSGVAFLKYHHIKAFTVWLPMPLGQISQYSMYWLMAMLTTIFRGVMLTYKAVALAIMLLTCIGSYSIAWSWSRSRVAAVAAATFYSFSPMAVAQWLSGHLDVEFSMAAGPLLVWAVARMIDTGSRRAGLGAGLCASALLLLTTGQAAYWLLAIAVIVAAKLARPRGLFRAATASSLAIAIAAFIGASAVQLGPWLYGASAPFAGRQNLAIEHLAIHLKYSLTWADAIAGIPGESWLLPGSHLGLFSFQSPLYIVPAVAVVAIAALAVAGATRGTAVLVRALIAIAAIAWLFQTGPGHLSSGLYDFFWQHVVYFRELRAPDRWQMVSSFAIAMLLAVSLARFAADSRGSRLAVRARGWLDRRRIGRLALRLTQTRAASSSLLALVAGLVLMLNAGSVVARGLPVMRPPQSNVAAYASMARQPGDWRVLTLPFDQPWMSGPAYGDYEGVESDLGYISSLYDGHSVLQNGGWDPRAAQFVAALEEMLDQGTDRHLTGLLAAAGIKYVVANPEPPLLAPSGQARFMESQVGLRLVKRQGRTEVLQVPAPQAPVNQPSSACVIAGGYGVLEDLTRDPGFDFRKTAVFFADQVMQTSGWAGLVRLVQRSHCLIMGPGADAELAVIQGTVTSAQASAIAPADWPSGAVDPLAETQATAAYWVGLPSHKSLTWTADVRKPGSYRVWVMMNQQPGAAAVRVAVNGKAAGDISAARPAELGYRWLPAELVRLASGRARISIRGTTGGARPQVAQIAVVRARGRKAALSRAIPRSWRVVDHSGLDQSLYRRARPDWSHPVSQRSWRPISGVRAARPRDHLVRLIPATAAHWAYTLAYVPLPRRLNASEPLAFEFKGTASKSAFYLTFFFRNGAQKSFEFEDVSKRRRLVAVIPEEGKPAWAAPGRSVTNIYAVEFPGRQVPDWNQVARMTISSTSPAWRSKPVSISDPYHLKLARSLPYFTGRLPAGRSAAASPAKLLTQNVTSTVSMAQVRPGFLDFSQTFDPDWQLTGVTSDLHAVELGFENSYLVSRGAARSQLRYGPAVAGIWGTYLSLLAWLIGLVVLIAWPLGLRFLKVKVRGRHAGCRWRASLTGSRSRSGLAERSATQ